MVLSVVMTNTENLLQNTMTFLDSNPFTFPCNVHGIKSSTKTHQIFFHVVCRWVFKIKNNGPITNMTAH